MDIIDLWWNASQQSELRNLRESLHATRVSARTLVSAQARMIELLEAETEELQLRLGVLIRLLVEKGLIAPEQFANAVADTRTLLAASRAPAPRAAAPRKLPKPPKLNPPKTTPSE